MGTVGVITQSEVLAVSLARGEKAERVRESEHAPPKADGWHARPRRTTFLGCIYWILRDIRTFGMVEIRIAAPHGLYQQLRRLPFAHRLRSRDQRCILRLIARIVAG